MAAVAGLRLGDLRGRAGEAIVAAGHFVRVWGGRELFTRQRARAAGHRTRAAARVLAWPVVSGAIPPLCPQGLHRCFRLLGALQDGVLCHRRPLGQQQRPPGAQRGQVVIAPSSRAWPTDLAALWPSGPLLSG